MQHFTMMLNRWSISCVATDRKFGVKARLSQALPVTLAFIRNHTHSTAVRNLQPVLTVLKSYANNGLLPTFLTS